MRKKELRAMRDKLEEYATAIQEEENSGKHEDDYNELYSHLDDAGAAINNILGE